MDDENEELRSYKKPCPQCSEVNWGISDDGKFYCQSCYTVIEKTKYIGTSINFENSKVNTFSRGLRKSRKAFGWEWYICEGFQFILVKQAEALEALGIGSDIKDNVMCNIWRLYLRKCRRAYCRRPLQRMTELPLTDDGNGAFSDMDTDDDLTDVASEVNSGFTFSDNRTDISDAETLISVQSGSVDGCLYKGKIPKRRKLAMPMTLAFCYLSLLWVRASITLSDLLRLAFYHHIPYYNSKQYFPEKTQMYGPDAHIFEVQDFPVYYKIMETAWELGSFIGLPRFPPITETCYYHPNVLCVKYLMEVNLPDELHDWTCYIVKEAKLDKEEVLTYDPHLRKARFIPYDIHAVAIIIVALKLIFVLNDKYEWHLADLAKTLNLKEKETTIFNFRKWYMSIKPCMDEACRKLEEEQARFSWEGERILSYNRKAKSRFMKMKRMTGNLKNQFSKLAGAAPDAGNRGPSSFLFNWEEQNTSKICFHGHSLKGIVQQKPLPSQRKTYWLNNMRKCRSESCHHWKQYDESQFPSSYRFIISLFALVLRVEPSTVHYEVSLVEEDLFKDIPGRKTPKPRRKTSVK